MEHHSNIVPWQMLCEEKGAKLRVIPMNDRGELILEEYEKLLNPRTRMVAVAHVSNALGTINPVQQIIDMAHRAGALALIDGAQAAPHMKVDVQALDADFYAFSGHKVFGPTGIGILYGKSEAAERHAAVPGRRRHDPHGHVREDHLQRPALQVRSRHAEYRRRHRPGRGARLREPASGSTRSPPTNTSCWSTAPKRSREFPGLRIIGTAREKAAVLSFVMEGIHPHDIGTVLDRQGIAVRTGHHCAQPVMDWFHVPATTRASLAFYNTAAEIDALAAGLGKVKEIFS